MIGYVNDKGTLEEIALEIALHFEKHETLFLSRSVRQVLFDGYRDPLIEDLCGRSEQLRKICRDLFKVPDAIGFFYGVIDFCLSMIFFFLLQRNGTDDGVYQIKTGQHDANEIGKIISWRNYTILPESWWSSNESRVIYGTDGQLFKPLITSTDRLPIFVGELCRYALRSFFSDVYSRFFRSVELEFKKSTQFEGIPALRFGMPDSALDPSRIENKGYCNPLEPHYFSNRTQPDECLPSGLLDISRCQPGNNFSFCKAHCH